MERIFEENTPRPRLYVLSLHVPLYAEVHVLSRSTQFSSRRQLEGILPSQGHANSPKSRVGKTVRIVHIYAEPLFRFMLNDPRYWGKDAHLFRPERFIETPASELPDMETLVYGFGRR
jgi:hypothetical protein